MPDPRKVLSIVQRAASLMRATPGRRGSIDHVADATDMLVVGDLHGHLSTFRQALKIAALDAHPRRHLVLQELVHGPFSYPDDRGDRSHQLVDVVCALKCQYPDRVHLILGNHELAEITGRDDRQERARAQRPLPPGGRHGLRVARRRDLRGVP